MQEAAALNELQISIVTKCLVAAERQTLNIPLSTQKLLSYSYRRHLIKILSLSPRCDAALIFRTYFPNLLKYQKKSYNDFYPIEFP